MRRIDHIVYCTRDLEKEVARLEKVFGTDFSPGGRHLTEGSKNVLLNLGNKCYLEVLAIDAANTEISAPRWMGIDLLTSDKITRWALKTDDSKKDAEVVKAYSSQMGTIKGGERITSEGKKLEWDLVMPLNSPEVEVVPFMTDWTKSDVHPTDNMPQNCELLEISLQHPNPREIEKVLEALNCKIRVALDSVPRISIKIKSPNGIIDL